MGFSNGQAKASDLSPLNGGGKLRADAARAYNALDRYLRAHNLGSLSNSGDGATYRAKGHPSDYPNGPFTQWYAWQRYQHGGNLAATPGTSNHGLGLAVDFRPDAIPLVAKYGNQFGWAKHGDAMGENWHYTYKPGNYSAVNKYSEVVAGMTIKPGDIGPGVVTMKKCLQKWGCWPRLWRIDNRYAGRTGRAVKAFQKSRHIKPDGIVGPATWQALKAIPAIAVKKPLIKPKPPVKHVNPGAKYFADIYSGDRTYDPKAYAAAGHTHIVLKASEGRTYYDNGFAERFAASARLTRWVYHFARPTANKPQEEAANFAKALQRVNLTADDRLVLDWEDPKYSANGSDWVQQFVDAMAHYGHEIRVIYSGGYYIENTITRWPSSKSGPLRYWHAAYITNPESSLPKIGGQHLVAVQYTDGTNGNQPRSIAGIGNCDISYFAGKR
ncbi:GH25_muramidase domain containing protein [uncultured Caudovirales phage]|uniref:lysozyme n=1 Tax=uncultured Caudovirales phage TaxID=2100421 RepID=A0A6J5QLB4_9CAUD|nr:GH25_muramidase domain containing protein [uncultured Caudovirales phage]CAB4199303.1 GH25_muramidase domain containing protein [uncultured Caudovirales phage]CAB5228448.1 GH25_muramidase domain containing protein [uncultured Caudovirales phage]